MSWPRLCAYCGGKPAAYPGVAYCFDCRPSGPRTPPPCRRCGSLDYYTHGLCRRCRRLAPPISDSCLDCLAWGVTRHTGWLCAGCLGWRRRLGPQRDCPSCRRVVVLNARGYCRLCCRQAHLVRDPHHSIDVAWANRHGQQLFLADLFRQRRPQAPPTTPAAAWPAGYPVAHRQLLLFSMDRDLTASQQRQPRNPPLPDLAAALDAAVTARARRYGWSPQLAVTTRQSLHVLLATQDTPGAPITATDIAALAQIRLHDARAVREVLADVGMLHDDREPSTDAWFATRTRHLPQPMASEVQQWYRLMRDGHTTVPRSRPCTPTTLRQHAGYVLPALHSWATAGHHSLREITAPHVVQALAAAAPPRRQPTLASLRKLFRLLKAHHITYTNPTTGLKAPARHPTTPLPMDTALLRQTLSADDPARAALAALIVFHALRAHQLRNLQLTDVRDGRLHLDGRTVPLADPTRQALAHWLNERARRWPRTLNPHLFINFYTAVRTCPVSREWISTRLGRSSRAMREDRILDEALASHGDVRLLCALFGLTVGGAMRYVHTTDQPPAGSPTQAPT